ncbi:MAG: lysine--tRNA ligase [Candidatus Babeliaceae bacterium]|jgi:lysyl-tRNA synthetase class 2
MTKNIIPPHDDLETLHSQEHEQRVKKVDTLRNQGIEPWPHNVTITETCQQVRDEFEAGTESKNYTIAGRILAIRSHGKSIFATVQDRSGSLQIYLKKDIIGDALFALFNTMIDIGDIISCHGRSFKTHMGEITLEVAQFELLSKCLFPLPEKFHGLTHIETKYRQRYLDLMTNPETRERFKKRSAIIRLIRNYLDTHDFMEVETPMLHPIPGGAAARPFVTHHNALNEKFFLRIAPELYLKRLIIGGYERVYEINRNFRNEGVSTRHNPEFTMLEFYMAYHDYQYGMSFVEDMLRTVMQESCGTLHVTFGNHTVDFEKPFDKLSAQQAIVKYSSITDAELTPTTIDATLKKHDVTIENKEASYGQKIFALFEHTVETLLIQPTYIIDYPLEISPLAKRDAKNPEYAARYELFIAGMEISNGFNELNDPFEQAERFKEQVKAHAAGDEEAMHYDEDYINALQHGLAPTVGVGIGIDRLVMIATGTTSIKEVILFPTLKRKI